MSTNAPVSTQSGLTPPFKVKAKYGWSGQAKGDLGFLEGDIMEVTKTTGEWYFGKLLRNERCSGYFPNNFVEILGEKPGGAVVNGNVTAQQQKRVTVPPVPNRASINSLHNSKNKASTNNWSSGSSSSGSLPLSPPMSPRSNGSSLTTPSPGGYQTTKSRHYNNNNNNNSDNNYNNFPLNRERDSSPEFYEKIRSHRSHPNLVSLGSTPTTAQNTINNSNNTARKSNILRTRQLNMANLSQDSLPPLPPLPSVSPDTFLPSKPVKSFSSNDLSLRMVNGGHHIRNHQQQNTINATFTDHLRGHPATFSNSKYMDSSTATTDSENSFALMSDFSATSAGSFARHRYAESFANSLQRSQQQQNTTTTHDGSTDELNNSNDGYMGSLLKRWLPPRSRAKEDTQTPKLPSLGDLNITTETTDKETKEWLLARAHLNRAKTLTRYEKHPRYMRALERNRDIILHPQDVIYNGLNSNEVTPRATPGSVDVQLAELNMEYIDKMTRRICDKSGNMSIEPWAKMTFLSNERYRGVLEQLRGIFVFCTEMFELVDQDGATKFSVEPPNMDRVLHSRYCTAFQLTWLFKKLANALGVVCEIVIGFLKTPGSDNTQFKYNHCWLRVLVNGEWKFVDVILGNITNPIHEFVNNKRRRVAGDGYFLVEPLRFIFTHIPAREFEQHIVPSIDQLSVLYLPLVFPSFFQNGLKLHNFCPALATLEDMEIYECSLEIPNDIEVFSSVVISNEDDNSREELAKFSQMELTLTQVRKHKPESGRRIVLIKAVLPQGTNSGTLYVHSGVRGKQATLANIHPVSMYIPLVHSGRSMDYEFVVRLPHPSAEKVEMYIKEPQNRYLFSGIEYNFVVNQNPYDGIIYKDSSKRDVRNKGQPMAIQSPSGKIYEMRKTEAQTLYGVWKTNVKVEELGVWSALVRDDSDHSWCEFAQWTCTH